MRTRLQNLEYVAQTKLPKENAKTERLIAKLGQSLSVVRGMLVSISAYDCKIGIAKDAPFVMSFRGETSFKSGSSDVDDGRPQRVLNCISLCLCLSPEVPTAVKSVEYTMSRLSHPAGNGETTSYRHIKGATQTYTSFFC